MQAGGARDTERVWREIAQRGDGRFIPIPQDGGKVVIIETPFDDEIIHLQGRINGTVIPYGPRAQRSSVERKTRQYAAAPAAVASEMAGYLSKSGARDGAAVTGRGDLVADVVSGRQELDRVKDEELPEQVRDLPAAARQAFIEKSMAERKSLSARMAELVKKRDRYVLEQRKVAPAGAADSSTAWCRRR